MVEQIDRDAAADILDEISSLLDHVGIGQVADLIRDGEYDEHDVVPIVVAYRAAERARILAAMRQPDAAMVERVLMAGYILTEEDTRAALSAAADHMEAGQ